MNQQRKHRIDDVPIHRDAAEQGVSGKGTSIDHSFLFIPDISGFTEFVDQTEIDHSQHIISELLEAIIDSNIIDMEVSEVEGDAVLFFKRREVPDLKKVLDQCRETFLGFHSVIKKYEKQRICNCGACTTAVNLKLKFIAHSGRIGFIKVKDFEKTPWIRCSNHSQTLEESG